MGTGVANQFLTDFTSRSVQITVASRRVTVNSADCKLYVDVSTDVVLHQGSAKLMNAKIADAMHTMFIFKSRTLRIW